MYLGLAMTATERLRLKPQNLLVNLPLGGDVAPAQIHVRAAFEERQVRTEVRVVVHHAGGHGRPTRWRWIDGRVKRSPGWRQQGSS